MPVEMKSTKEVEAISKYTITISWWGIQEDSANNATAYTCHRQQSLKQMRWSKWTEPQKQILSFAIFLEKNKIKVILGCKTK